jgi:hypothetical protein
VVIEGTTHGITPCTACEKTPGQPFRSAALAIVKHTIITIALNTSLIPAILFRQGGDFPLARL